MGEASRRLGELRPVTFRYRHAGARAGEPLEYGLIAEEVARVYPDLVARGAGGQIETVQYHKLTPMLLNEVQRLNRELQAEKDRYLAQAEQLRAQEAALEASQSRHQAQDQALRSEQARNQAQEGVIQEQARAIAGLQQQVALVQAQARRWEALSARLARFEKKEPMASLAGAAGSNRGH